ncbi:Multidrug resistance-associated protein 4, partial [Trichoplax sp. H2]
MEKNNHQQVASKKAYKRIPLDTDSWFTRVISFWWLNKLFQISAKRRLELEDLYQLSDADKSDALLKKFDREWDKELKVRDNGGRPSLTRALFRIFGFSYLLIGIPCLIGLCSRTVYPIFIGLLVGCFSPQSTADKTQGYLYALGLSLSMFIIVFCEQPAYFSAYRVGSQLRTVLSAAVYRKVK